MKKALILLFLVLATQLQAQKRTFFSQSELGFHVGQTYYLGDLNPYQQFKNAALAGGLIYRYNFNNRLTLRCTYLYGQIAAADSTSPYPLLVNRNLSFKSTLHEVATGLEFHFVPFQFGSSRYPATAYLLAQIGVFHMNPQTYYNGAWQALQPLATEGQGTSASTQKPYNLYQPCVPLGMGLKVSLGKMATLNLDLSIRKTFTDYLDDVGSDFYTDPQILEDEVSDLSAALSNQSLDGNRFGKRGTSSTKDWYVYAGATFTFRLGKGGGCFY
ncbi:MAG: hypothetical protein EAZ48_04275 [Flavobacteriia bacterium]|jgi:hypothetical protein|nr:MAG: hypothetical protein EAZ48_04275 [Flavobacteriia bacterium]